MSKKFIIKKRYEYFSSEGKRFTDWFTYDATPVDEKIGNERIKQAKNEFKDIERITKLKHEYQLFDYDEHVRLEDECKKQIAEKQASEHEYLQSDEYRELQKRKRAEARERKSRQKQYIEKYAKDDDKN